METSQEAGLEVGEAEMEAAAAAAAATVNQASRVGDSQWGEVEASGKGQAQPTASTSAWFSSTLWRRVQSLWCGFGSCWTGMPRPRLGERAMTPSGWCRACRGWGRPGHSSRGRQATALKRYLMNVPCTGPRNSRRDSQTLFVIPGCCFLYYFFVFFFSSFFSVFPLLPCPLFHNFLILIHFLFDIFHNFHSFIFARPPRLLPFPISNVNLNPLPFISSPLSKVLNRLRRVFRTVVSSHLGEKSPVSYQLNENQYAANEAEDPFAHALVEYLR